ncbi:MAG: hypothetical protein KatS3mg058_2236 [Roseiflexus sp.]|nr:MAG: hypothetical protein KatS3mg058_2236 [Roseiflexus sp.]
MRDKSRATPWSGPSRLSLLASPQMRDTSRATPLSGPSPLSPLASRLSTLHKCEINLALRHGRDPRASPQMRDTSCATLWSEPSRFSTNARYISRYAMVGTLSTLHKCEIHLALRHGRNPLNSPQMRDTSRATPWSGPSPLSPLASRLSTLHKCEINLALRHGRDPLASPQMRDKSRATPWSGPSRLSTNAR